MKLLFIISFCLLLTHVCFAQKFTYDELKQLYFADTNMKKNILTVKDYVCDETKKHIACPLGVWDYNEDFSVIFSNEYKCTSNLIEQDSISLNYFFEDSRYFKAIYKELNAEKFPPLNLHYFYGFYDFKAKLIILLNEIPESFEGRRRKNYFVYINKFRESYKESGKPELENQDINIDYKGISFKGKAWWLVSQRGLYKKNHIENQKDQIINCFGINDGLKEFFSIEINKDSTAITLAILMDLAKQLKQELSKSEFNITVKKPYPLMYAGYQGFAVDYSQKNNAGKINVRQIVIGVDNHIIWIMQMAYNKELDSVFNKINKTLKFDSSNFFKKDTQNDHSPMIYDMSNH